MGDRINRIQLMIDTLNLSRYELAKRSGLAASNLNKMMSGDQTITDKTLLKIAAAFPQVNKDWLKTGEGEMLNPGVSGNLTVGSGIGIQGTVGHDVTQTNTPEIMFQDFISGLKTQNKLTEKAIDQTSAAIAQTEKAMSQTDKAMDQVSRALDEISESRKMIQNLINLIGGKPQS